MRQHFQEFVEHLPTHQQRLAHDKEKPHAEVASPWSKSLLQPFAQLHLEFRLLYCLRFCFSTTRGALNIKPMKSQGLSILSGTDTVYSWKKEETRKTIVIAAPRDQPVNKQMDWLWGSPFRRTCCKKGFVEVSKEPSMDGQIPVLPEL